MTDTWIDELYYCAESLPTEVLEIIICKSRILAAPISASGGFDDYGLNKCAGYVSSLAHGGAIRDGVMYTVENAGKCSMRLMDSDGEVRDFRKTPGCVIHGCRHDW